MLAASPDRYGLRRLLLLWLLLVCLGIPLSAQSAPPPGEGRSDSAAPNTPLPVVERSEDDMLLFAVHLDTYTLSEELEGYTGPKGTLFPLGEICQLLSLNVIVTPAAGKASGFVIEESRVFQLDVGKQTATMNHQALRYDSTQLEIHQNDIYVTRELLEAWLPIIVLVDQHASLITIHGKELLPLEQHLAREAKVIADFTRAGRSPDDQLRTNPYRWFSLPSIDQTLTLQAASGGQQTGLAYTGIISGDVAQMNSLIYLSKDEQSPWSARMTLMRADPDGQVFGMSNVREVQGGYIAFPEIPLLIGNQTGTGVVLSNYPLTRPTTFDTHTFRGTLLPGWDAELYRNGVLLSIQTADTSGEYLFADVPLYFGLNTFRLVLYGPHGERREEKYNFNIGDAQLKHGEAYYRLAYMDSDGTQCSTLQCDYGVNRNVSLTNSVVVSQAPSGQEQDYEEFGLRGFARQYYGQFDVATDGDAHWSSRYALQTRWGDTNVSLQQTRTEMSGITLQSGNTSATTTLGTQTLLRLDGIQLPWRSSGLQPLGVTVSYDQPDTGDNETDIGTRFSGDWHTVQVSQYLDWTQSQGDGLSTHTITANSVFSRRVAQLQMSCDAAYTLSPDIALTTLTFGTSAALRHDYHLNVSASYGWQQQSVGLVCQVTRTIGAYALGMNASYTSTTHVYALGMTLSGNVQSDPRGDRWVTDARPLAQLGTASLRAFLDAKQTGHYDPGDPLLPNVGFVVNGQSSDSVTNAQGTALLRGLPAFQPVDICVSPSTLDDPSWDPVPHGVYFLSRPGQPILLDFPVRPTGEIAGTVTIEDGGHKRIGQGLTIQLQRAGDRVVALQTRAAYDGYYTFEKVPIGNYYLCLDPRQVDAFHGTQTPRLITIPAQGGYLDGIDLSLVRAPAP